MPGFGDSPLSWSMVMAILHPVLKLHYDEVILFDFPGFGGFLNRERSFPSMDLMCTAVNDALDALKPHTIMGHSLGAWLSAMYAGSCGEGVRPTANKLNYSGPETVLLANPSGIFLDQKVRDDWESIFKGAMAEGFHHLRPHLFAKEPPWFRFIAPYFSGFMNREDIHQFMGTFRDEHCADRAASKIKSKVWLLWGDSDTLIPASCTRAWFKNLNPNNKDQHQAIWIKGVGHSPHIEKPAVTAAVIGQILSGRTPHSVGKRWWKVFKNE
jgi:pimeloyl-ACP methyl ester carboxylesterase